MLGVAALQLCHPIELLVLVKSDYPSLQGLSLPSRTHEPLPDLGLAPGVARRGTLNAELPR